MENDAAHQVESDTFRFPIPLRHQAHDAAGIVERHVEVTVGPGLHVANATDALEEQFLVHHSRPVDDQTAECRLGA
jgi:hypothetical protein